VLGGESDTTGGIHLDLEHTFQPAGGVVLNGEAEVVFFVDRVVIADGGVVIGGAAETTGEGRIVVVASGGILLVEGILKDPTWGTHYWAAYHPYHLGTPFMIRALQLENLKPQIVAGLLGGDPDTVNWTYIPGDGDPEETKLNINGTSPKTVYWEPEPPPIVCDDGPYGVILTGHINLSGSACIQDQRWHFTYIIDSELSPLILNSAIPVHYIYLPDGGFVILDPRDDLGWACLDDIDWEDMSEEEWTVLLSDCPFTIPHTVHIPYVAGADGVGLVIENLDSAEVEYTTPDVYDYIVGATPADSLILNGYVPLAANHFVYVGGADGIGLTIEDLGPGAITELSLTFIIDETEVGLILEGQESSFAEWNLVYEPVDWDAFGDEVLKLTDPGAIVTYGIFDFTYTPGTEPEDALDLDPVAVYVTTGFYIPGTDVEDALTLGGRNYLVISHWAYIGGGDGIGLVIEDLSSAPVDASFSFIGGADDVGLVIEALDAAPAGMLHVIYLVPVDVGLNLTPVAIVERSAYNYYPGATPSDQLDLTPVALAAVTTRHYVVPPSSGTGLGDRLRLNGRNYPVVSAWTYVGGQDGGLIIVPDSGQTHYPPDAIIHYIYYGYVILGLDPNALVQSSDYVYVPGLDEVGLLLLSPGALVEITTLHYGYAPPVDVGLILNGTSPMWSSAYVYYGDDSVSLIINGDPGEFQFDSPSPFVPPGTPPYYIWHYNYIPTDEDALVLIDPAQ